MFSYKKGKRIITSSQLNNINKTIIIFFVFFLGIIPTIRSQENNINVLIIPFPSYHFQSSFDLLDIAFVNEIPYANEVYKTFQDSLVRELSKGKLNYKLFEIPENEFQSIKYLLEPVFIEKPTGHYGIDKEKLTKSSAFNNMIKNLGVDYVLFLTNYRIDTKLYTSSRSFDGSYALPWSRHLLDYELVDKKINLVALSRELELKANNPNNETYLTKGLLLSTMNKGFSSLVNDFHLKIQQYNLTQKPQFKAKRRKNKKSKNK